MLVNCPRCGFTQPKDQYCAQCGVDMLAFRKPSDPAWKKLIGNPVLQLSLVLLIAAAGGYSIYRQRQSDLEERVRYLKGGAQVARSQSLSEGARGPENSEDSSSTAPGSTLTEEVTTPPPDLASAQAAAPASAGGALKSAETAPDANAAPPAAAASLRARFIFVEMSQVGLERLFEESRGTGQFNQIGDHDAGLVPNLAQKVSTNNREVKILHQEERPIATGSTQFFVGLHPGEPESEIGFTVYLERSEGEGGTSRGNLEVVRSWRERFTPTEPLILQRKNYPAVFELASGSGFFMSGLLPTTGLTQNDQEILSLPPFQIFRSNAFRGGTSEMVLFVEFLK